MKYLCLEMNACPKAEIDTVMRECQPHMEALYRSNQIIIDVGLSIRNQMLATCERKLSQFRHYFAGISLPDKETRAFLYSTDNL
jgi:phosphoribosyl 1,2-cyclic phosphodiesterase